MLTLFLSEGRELLNRVDAELLVLERTPESRSSLDEVFRALHSLKGMSATVALDDAATALHSGETVLTAAREIGHVDAPRLAALLALSDGVRSALDDAERGVTSAPLADIARRLDALAPQTVAPRDARKDRAKSAREVQRATAAVGARWRVDVRIDDAAVAPAARVTVLLRGLAALAHVVGVSPDEAMRAEDSWDRNVTVWLGTAVSRDPVDAAVIERSARRAGEVAECRVVREVAAAGEAASGSAAQTVRIPAQRLDELLDLIGELVVARDRLIRDVGRADDHAEQPALDDVSRLILQLRDSILRSRMVPLGQVFDRFPRHVRDTALALGKEIDLVLEGRELEVDRSLLDELSDPLLHLLRNAMDHGLETPDERRSAGKDARGRLVVRAVRDGSMIAVSVADDGRGVNRERVAVSALAQGVTNAAALSHDDHGLLQLLARPGLSTATTVTALSGRGVGVDAVLSRVQGLGGRLELATAEGTGTVITIRLPLSVAMLRALLVRVASETYAIPLTLIRSTHLAAPHWERDTRELPAAVELAGERLRLVSLRSHLGLPAADDVSGHLVVLDGAEERLALLVDACMSQREIVVKPLQRVRGAASKFSGGTILPDGTPSLILDINSLP